MKIDPNKKYRTRDGREVTLLHRAPEGWPNSYPWRGLVSGDHVISWADDGSVGPVQNDRYDLVEVRDPREFDVFVRHDGTVYHSPQPFPHNLYVDTKGEVIRVREVIEEGGDQ